MEGSVSPRETDSNTIIVKDFNVPLTSMARSSKQKINKETLSLNNRLDQMDLTYTEHSIKSTFFSSAHGTFSRIDHILGHKRSLNEFKKTEII